MVRIFTSHIEQSLKDAKHKRFSVLRHKQNVTAVLFSNFVNELRESFRVG